MMSAVITENTSNHGNFFVGTMMRDAMDAIMSIRSGGVHQLSNPRNA